MANEKLISASDLITAIRDDLYIDGKAFARVKGHIEEADAVEVVRCKDCEYFKPAHFKADDGTETPWDETFNWDDRSDGIYHGGKCKHERNTAYGQKNMAFRKPDDFCSYGERR